MPNKPKRPGKKALPSPTRVIRRKKLASAVLQGVPVNVAAKQLGVTRSYASREINSPEGRTIIDKMVDRRSERIEQLLDLALDAIEAHVRPTYGRPPKLRKGEKYNDPKVRMVAVKRVMEIALAGRNKNDVKTETNTFTMQQFLSVYNAPKEGPIS